MGIEYVDFRGKNLLLRLTKDGIKPIDKEAIATLSTEDIEAMIIAIRAVNDEE